MLNSSAVDSFSFEAFHKRWPFPWHDFDAFLIPEAFQELYRDFPPLNRFVYQENIYRLGQRPHNRYYLGLDISPYSKKKQEAGLIGRQELPSTWQQFIRELEEGPLYRNFIDKALQNNQYSIRYCWHVGQTSNEVSPHRDHTDKIGTHIFYFNTSQDWDDAWGGQLLVLGDLLVPGITPDFKDFTTSTSVKTMNNHSFLFKNTPNAWHGVKALKCPEGKFRKLFNVIFQKEGTHDD